MTTNKASRGDGIPVELFQILKDDVVKGLHSILENLENSAMATGLEKDSFHSNPKEGQLQRTTVQQHSFHTVIKIMLRILQGRLQ